VHDIVFIEFFKSLEQLSENDKGLILFEEFLLLNKIFNSALITVLVNEIKIIWGL